MAVHEESGAVVATAHDHHDHDHDFEPDEALSSSERTPMWMPLVGGIVFVLGIVTFVATRPPGKTAAELQKEAAAAAAELRAKRAAEAAPPPAPQPGVGAPGREVAQMGNPSMPQPGRAPGRGG